MNTKIEIQKALEKELNERCPLEGDAIVILNEATIEGNDYFVFFTTQKNLLKRKTTRFVLQEMRQSL